MKPARILYWLDDDYDEAANLMGQLIEVTAICDVWFSEGQRDRVAPSRHPLIPPLRFRQSHHQSNGPNVYAEALAKRRVM